MQLTTVTNYEWADCEGQPGVGNWRNGKWVPAGCDGRYTDDYGSYQSCRYCGGSGRKRIVIKTVTKVTG